MTNALKIFALAMFAGCSAQKVEPLLLPQGNMPMTEQEYQEAERLLIKKPPLSTDEREK